jgi:1,2-diacylglycerol-3-alpha-glucose alpha-1,2-glucosyltransferase
MYKHAGMIITPTPYSEKIIKGYGICDKVVNVTNGINLDDYKPDQNKVDEFKKYFSITDEKVVIGIGFPFERKGIHDFFEIARKNPDVKFFWFGHLAKILTPLKILKAIKNKPSNVIMPGYIDNSIVKGAMQYASCFLFPSYEETEGIVVLEALASKSPVLVRNIGVYEPWLEDGKNCLMASNNEEFSTKLKYVLNNDNKEMIENGYKVVEERTLEIVGSKLKDIYEEFYNSSKK